MDEREIIVLPYGKMIPSEILEELENLINDGAQETVLHNLLEENPEILPGVDPATIFSRKRIEFPDGRIIIPDLIVLPKNKLLFDIIELKGADQSVVRGNRKAILPSKARDYTAAVHRALRQLQVYSDLFEDRTNREYVKRKIGIDIYRPKLTLITGRSHHFINEFERRDLQRQHPSIELTTWDDLLAEAKDRVFQKLVIPVSMNISSCPNIVVRSSERRIEFAHLATIYGNEQYGVAVFSRQELKNTTVEDGIPRALLDQTPFTQSDIAEMVGMDEAVITKWSSGESLHDCARLVALIALLGVDERHLSGFTNEPFVRSIPRGETGLLTYVQLVKTITRKSACSVYRYDPQENAFVIAAYCGYGRGLKTKFKYKMGDGVTGNIIYKHNGLPVVFTKEEQQKYLSTRITEDDSAFLLIAAVRDREGKLLGCIKIEDTRVGRKSDIKYNQLNDILAMGRIYLENVRADGRLRQWWKSA